MQSQEIQMVLLDTRHHENNERYCTTLLDNEIEGIHVEHVAITNQCGTTEASQRGLKTIYLFIKGTGIVAAGHTSYEIVPETIFLPNSLDEITISTTDDSLHYLRIACELSAQDNADFLRNPRRTPKTSTLQNSVTANSTAKPSKAPIR